MAAIAGVDVGTILSTVDWDGPYVVPPPVVLVAVITCSVVASQLVIQASVDGGVCGIATCI